jgi:hypothetical protein
MGVLKESGREAGKRRINAIVINNEAESRARSPPRGCIDLEIPFIEI